MIAIEETPRSPPRACPKTKLHGYQPQPKSCLSLPGYIKPEIQPQYQLVSFSTLVVTHMISGGPFRRSFR